MFETRTDYWHSNSAAFESYWHFTFFLEKFKKLEVQWCILSQIMSNSNSLDLIAILLSKNMYEPIYDIRNFRECLLESSMMAVFLVESWHQFNIPLSGRDFKTSDSCRKFIFKQQKYISFRNQYSAHYYRVVVFYLLLISVATIVAAHKQ